MLLLLLLFLKWITQQVNTSDSDRKLIKAVCFNLGVGTSCGVAHLINYKRWWFYSNYYTLLKEFSQFHLLQIGGG